MSSDVRSWCGADLCQTDAYTCSNGVVNRLRLRRANIWWRLNMAVNMAVRSTSRRRRSCNEFRLTSLIWTSEPPISLRYGWIAAGPIARPRTHVHHRGLCSTRDHSTPLHTTGGRVGVDFSVPDCSYENGTAISDRPVYIWMTLTRARGRDSTALTPSPGRRRKTSVAGTSDGRTQWRGQQKESR